MAWQPSKYIFTTKQNPICIKATASSSPPRSPHTRSYATKTTKIINSALSSSIHQKETCKLKILENDDVENEDAAKMM